MTASTVTPARQSGVWPWQRSGGLRIRLHGAHQQVDADDAMRGVARRVAHRHRRPEHRDHRGADRRGEMHRAGVAGEDEAGAFQHRGEDEQIGAGR